MVDFAGQVTFGKSHTMMYGKQMTVKEKCASMSCDTSHISQTL